MAQIFPESRAISRRVLFPIELVAWRSSRAEAKKAVAVRAARETSAKTLISAKLGEPLEGEFLLGNGMGFSFSGNRF
jgi:hypothetical protein